MTWAETMDLAFSLWKANFWPLVGLTAIGMAPLMAIQVWVNWEDLIRWASGPWPGVVSPFLLVAIPLIVDVAVFHSIRTALEGRRIEWAAGYRYALSRFFPFFVTGLLWVGALVLGLLLFIIPGLFIVPFYFALVTPVGVYENCFYFRALGRSWQLVTGAYWKTQGVLFFYLNLYLAALAACCLPILVPVAVAARTFTFQPTPQPPVHFLFFNILFYAIIDLFSLLSLPLGNFVVAVLYRERLAAREGEDVETVIARAEATA